MKVKTHSIKEITWILSLSPRECLGFRLLQFISFKNKWRGKEPSLEFVKKPAPLFSTLSAYRKHPAQLWPERISQGFKEGKILEFDFQKLIILVSRLHLPRHTCSLSFSFSTSPNTHQEDFYIMYATHIVIGKKKAIELWTKDKERNLKYFKVIRATDSCSVLNIVLLWITGHTVATSAGGKSWREMEWKKMWFCHCFSFYWRSVASKVKKKLPTQEGGRRKWKPLGMFIMITVRITARLPLIISHER